MTGLVREMSSASISSIARAWPTMAKISVRQCRRTLSKTAECTVARMNEPLKQFDPTLYNILREEKERQFRTINLIASENFTPRYCSEALASCASMKYSEGTPGDRYYAGNENIDVIERLCQERALAAFDLDPNIWDVSVQPHSGSPANFAVYTALLKPKDKILFLNLPHGGHLSHGFGTNKIPVTATCKYFNTRPYYLDQKNELINYLEMENIAKEFEPHLIIAGASAYPREIDYEFFRRVSDNCNAYLMSDIAHISGLMSAKILPSAFNYSDVVTTTTHKTLRGPRGAMVFMKKELASKIHKAIFPGCQGGPHNHSIAAIAAALKACKTDEYVDYQKQVVINAKALAEALSRKGIRLCTGGTDNHLVLLDLTGTGASGSHAELLLERVGIVTNRNTVVTDKSPKKPHGIRLGTPCMTSRGMTQAEFQELGDIIANLVLEFGSRIKAKKVPKPNDYLRNLFKSPDDYSRSLLTVKNRLEKLARSFPEVSSAIWPPAEKELCESKI